MIELNEKTQQDFLNREWVQRLLDAGVDMSDAKYEILKTVDTSQEYINYCGKYDPDCGKYINGIEVTDKLPTYTVSELLYKLRNRYGIYTIFNCYRNLDVDNIPIIESFASILLQQYNETI